MVSPSLATVSRQLLLPCLCRATRVVPPAREYFWALSNRISRTCRNCAALPFTEMFSAIAACRISPFSKKIGSKGSVASQTRRLRSTVPKGMLLRMVSARASSSICSTRLRICRDITRILAANEIRSVSV